MSAKEIITGAMSANQNQFAGALKEAILGVVNDWTLSERLDYFSDLSRWATDRLDGCWRKVDKLETLEP